MEYYRRGQMTGVLISSGYGAGWSTWGYDDIAYDKRIIDFWNPDGDHPSEEDMHNYLNSIGYKDVYMGGYDNLRLLWILTGSIVKVVEYDGAEFIETVDYDSRWRML